MSAFRAQFGDAIPEADLEHLRFTVNKGWALGSDRFIDDMQQALGRALRPPRRGRPKKRRH
jgi:hypothetical protein